MDKPSTDFLMYGGETIIWKEKERPRFKAVQMDTLPGIKRMDKVLNAQIKKLCGITKGLTIIFYNGLAMWRKWNDRITKRVYAG